jgi:hypothetical protein
MGAGLQFPQEFCIVLVGAGLQFPQEFCIVLVREGLQLPQIKRGSCGSGLARERARKPSDYESRTPGVSALGKVRLGVSSEATGYAQ